MTTQTAARPLSRTAVAKMTTDDIASITDVEQRGAAAGVRVKQLSRDLAKHRVRRNMAMLVLLQPPHNWKKMDVIRLVGVSRTMFVGVVNRAPAELPDVKRPQKAAEDAQAKINEIDAAMEHLIEIRNAAIIDMLFDGARANHEVAKITGESQVRVAQLRSGALGD